MRTRQPEIFPAIVNNCQFPADKDPCEQVGPSGSVRLFWSMLSETSSQELDSPAHAGAQDEPYRAIIKLLAQTLALVAPPSLAAVDRLKALAFDAQRPFEASKLEAHRAALEQSISPLQQELLRIRQAAQVAAGALPPDSATGLPGPASAQQLIAARMREGKETFAAVLVLDQLKALNARFGRTVGDEVLILTAQDLDSRLNDAGVLHRWRGPAFVVICTQGQQQAVQLEDRMRALVAKRLEKTLNIESRSIHVKITFSWQLQEVHCGETAEAVARRFDDFVASHTGGGRER